MSPRHGGRSYTGARALPSAGMVTDPIVIEVKFSNFAIDAADRRRRPSPPASEDALPLLGLTRVRKPLCDAYQCRTISYSAMRFGSIFELSSWTPGTSSP